MSRTGDLWALGDHRLLCGDAIDPAVVATLMAGEQPQLCFTSPPYANQRSHTTGGIDDWDGLDARGLRTVASEHRRPGSGQPGPGAPRGLGGAPSRIQLHDQHLIERLERQAPAAVRYFQEDFDACIAQLRVPVSHRRMVRTVNLLERLFEEGRRRYKVAPTVCGGRPVLKLLYASAMRASDSWHGIRITETVRSQLERLQAQLAETAKQENVPAVNVPSTPQRIPSGERT